MKKREEVAEGYIKAFRKFKNEGVSWTVALENQNISNSYPYMDLDRYFDANTDRAKLFVADLVALSNRVNNGSDCYIDLIKTLVKRHKLVINVTQQEMDSAVRLLDIPFNKNEPTDIELIRMISERGLTCEGGKWYKVTKIEIQ